jgi:hypothetical protein
MGDAGLSRHCAYRVLISTLELSTHRRPHSVCSSVPACICTPGCANARGVHACAHMWAVRACVQACLPVGPSEGVYARARACVRACARASVQARHAHAYHPPSIGLQRVGVELEEADACALNALGLALTGTSMSAFLHALDQLAAMSPCPSTLACVLACACECMSVCVHVCVCGCLRVRVRLWLFISACVRPHMCVFVHLSTCAHASV